MSATRSPHKVSPERKAFRVDDFCRTYGVGRTTTYRLLNSGQLKSAMIAGRRVILAESADRLLTQTEFSTSTKKSA